MADADDEATNRLIYQLIAGDLYGQQDGGNDVQVGAMDSNEDGEDDEIYGLDHEDQEDDDDDDEADNSGVALDWNFQPVHQSEHEVVVLTQDIEEDHDLYCADGEENGRYDAENQSGEGGESSKSYITGPAEGHGATATDEWDALHPQDITTTSSESQRLPGLLTRLLTPLKTHPTITQLLLTPGSLNLWLHRNTTSMVALTEKIALVINSLDGAVPSQVPPKARKELLASQNPSTSTIISTLICLASLKVLRKFPQLLVVPSIKPDAPLQTSTMIQRRNTLLRS